MLGWIGSAWTFNSTSNTLSGLLKDAASVDTIVVLGVEVGSLNDSPERFVSAVRAREWKTC